MKNVEKILAEYPTKKEAVIKILGILNEENITNAVEILDMVKHYLKNHSYLNYDLARAEIIKERRKTPSFSYGDISRNKVSA